MNTIKNLFSTNFTGVQRILSNFPYCGLLRETVTKPPCVGLATPSFGPFHRFYGTLKALHPQMSSSFGALQSVTSAHPSRPLLTSELNNNLIEKDGVFTPDTFYIQSRGLKYKGRVRRRCRDCYLMWVNGNLYNLCKTHARHKTMQKPPYFPNQRILTHATMSPKRPW